jgi:hypothetical protein
MKTCRRCWEAETDLFDADGFAICAHCAKLTVCLNDEHPMHALTLFGRVGENDLYHCQCCAGRVEVERAA